MSTRDPEARILATAPSKISASVSGSPPGRMMSLPPAARETSPGDIAIAAGTWSATIWRISLPRTARLAYWSPGCSTAISPASRSAQPRYPPPGAASLRPSVKLSPIATKDASPGGCENRLSSIVHPSCQDTPWNLTHAESNNLVVGSRVAAARITRGRRGGGRGPPALGSDYAGDFTGGGSVRRRRLHRGRRAVGQRTRQRQHGTQGACRHRDASTRSDARRPGDEVPIGGLAGVRPERAADRDRAPPADRREAHPLLDRATG